jgi:hypothetical protein
VRLVPAAATAVIELPGVVEEEMTRAASPHLVLAERIAQGLRRLGAVRHEFDVAAIYLPERWAAGFYGPEGDDFDLHAFIKATAAAQRIPTQLLREGRVLRYRCRASVAWRLGIAFYTKAGGTPWRLSDIEQETAFVGIGYRLREGGGNGGRRFVTCCSQVFDADGTGFEFLVYSTNDFHTEQDNPFLSRGETQRLMARSLTLYQRRHSGQSPRRVIVHKTTEFKPEEIDGCYDAFRAIELIDLLQIQQECAWRGVQIEQPRRAGERRGAPSGYPVMRGTFLPLSGREVLLWTQGDAPDAVGGAHYYKEGKGIPEPLLLRRFAGHGDWEDSCRYILALTKMNWNSDALYDRLPVTISHAQALADVARKLARFDSTPYQSRLFM